MYSVLLASSLLVLLNTARCTNAFLLDSVTVEVPAGNFSYLSLNHPGLVSLILITNFGDCDIYVSQFQTKPSYEHDAYCLQSSSCGVDSVVVPERFKRPLSIGIYGHPSHKISKCTLTSYLIDVTSDSDDKLDELFITTKYGGIAGNERYLEESKDTSEYEYLPYLMVFLYYINNCLLYILDFIYNCLMYILDFICNCVLDILDFIHNCLLYILHFLHMFDQSPPMEVIQLFLENLLM